MLETREFGLDGPEIIIEGRYLESAKLATHGISRSLRMILFMGN